MDLSSLPDILREKVSNIKSTAMQKTVTSIILRSWHDYSKDSMTQPFPEPDVIITPPFDDETYEHHIEISWAKRAAFYIEDSWCGVCVIIYTTDANEKVSPPMHFMIKTDGTTQLRPFAKAIQHTFGHIDLFEYQNNFDAVE